MCVYVAQLEAASRVYIETQSENPLHVVIEVPIFVRCVHVAESQPPQKKLLTHFNITHDAVTRFPSFFQIGYSVRLCGQKWFRVGDPFN